MKLDMKKSSYAFISLIVGLSFYEVVNSNTLNTDHLLRNDSVKAESLATGELSDKQKALISYNFEKFYSSISSSSTVKQNTLKLLQTKIDKDISSYSSIETSDNQKLKTQLSVLNFIKTLIGEKLSGKAVLTTSTSKSVSTKPTKSQNIVVNNSTTTAKSNSISNNGASNSNNTQVSNSEPIKLEVPLTPKPATKVDTRSSAS